MLSLPQISRLKKTDMNNILVFNRKDLIEALAYGASCAGVNKSLPIADYIHIKVNAGENNVMIESNSLALAARTTVSVEQPAFEDVDFCILPDGLQKTLATLGDNDVTLSLYDTFVEVVYGKGKAKFPTINAEEFPRNFDTATEIGSCTLPAQMLKYILTASADFVGNDDLRPMMQATSLTFGENDFECAATDAHKLFCEKFTTASVQGSGTSLCIPKSAHKVLVSLIGNIEAPLTIRNYEKFSSVAIGDKEAYFTLLEGKYPNYRAVIPAETEETRKITVVKDELMSAVKRMNILASQTTKTIVLDCNASEIIVSAEDIDNGTGGSEKVGVKSIMGNDAPVRIGFNAVFLQMCLNNIQNEYITLNFTTPYRAATFHDESAPDKTVMLMPVMLNVEQ